MRRLVALLITMATLPVFATERPDLDSREKIDEEVEVLWQEENYQELESIERYLLSRNPKSKSGYSMVYLFNGALANKTHISYDLPAVWTGLHRQAERWANRSPKSPIAHLNVAFTLLNRAWQIRGSGYANTVTPEQWEGFRAYSLKAREYLLQKKDVAQKNPGWYSQMLRIGLSQSMPETEFKSLLDEGMSRFPYYEGLALAAIDHYSPKWGGSMLAIKSFIDGAVTRLPVAEQDGQYANLYSYVFQEHVRGVEESLVDCKRWTEGAIANSNRYPSKYNYSWSAYAAVACGDRKIAGQYFALIDGEPEIPPWRVGKNARDMYAKARAWAEGRTNDSRGGR